MRPRKARKLGPIVEANRTNAERRQSRDVLGLVGSTALGPQDPEDLPIIRPTRDASQRPCSVGGCRQAGTGAVYFGIPNPEDDAERAVRAGLN